MSLGHSAKARVVDIRNRSSPLPRTVAADANVLYIVNYDFAELTGAGGRGPTRDQSRHYTAWLKRATAEGVSVCTAASVLVELVHLIERTELEIIWRQDPSQPELDPDHPGQDFSPKYAKRCRYIYCGHLERIRQNVETTLKSVTKNVHIIPHVGGDEAVLRLAMKEWVSSIADFGDATLVAAARKAGIAHIISDDADLLSIEGIHLYTANQRAINAAREAGTLVIPET